MGRCTHKSPIMKWANALKESSKKFTEAKCSLSQQCQLVHWYRWVPRTHVAGEACTTWGPPCRRFWGFFGSPSYLCVTRKHMHGKYQIQFPWNLHFSFMSSAHLSHKPHENFFFVKFNIPWFKLLNSIDFSPSKPKLRPPEPRVVLYLASSCWQWFHCLDRVPCCFPSFLSVKCRAVEMQWDWFSTLKNSLCLGFPQG